MRPRKVEVPLSDGRRLDQPEPERPHGKKPPTPKLKWPINVMEVGDEFFCTGEPARPGVPHPRGDIHTVRWLLQRRRKACPGVDFKTKRIKGRDDLWVVKRIS